MELSAWDLITKTGPIVKLVLASLLFASVLSWTVILAKWFDFKTAKKESDHFLDLFWNAKSMDSIFAETKNFSASPVSNVFRAGYMEFQKVTAKGKDKSGDTSDVMIQGIENVQRALRKAITSESLRLEKKVPTLATIASVSPFIGLFGTVWGIMNSFMGLSQAGAATLQKVAPGIAEALVTTAVGLAAAIPAVIAYNQYLIRMRHLRVEMDSFASDFTNILKRNFMG